MPGPTVNLPELERLLGEVFSPAHSGQDERKRFVTLDSDGDREYGARQIGGRFFYSGQGPLLGQPIPDNVPVVEEVQVDGKWQRCKGKTR